MKKKQQEYKKLSWDSNFFGYGVAQILETIHDKNELHLLLEELAKENIRVVYLLLDPADTRANAVAIKNNGILVDEKVVYTRELPSTDSDGISPEIISYLGKDVTNQLASLAIQSGEYSRFKLDPHFGKGVYEGLYTQWIKNSLSGEMAEEVLVDYEDGKELGMIVLGKKDKRCDITLLAVDVDYRGRAIGKKLMNAAFLTSKKVGYSTIQVVTQKRNTGACSFYEKLGFKQESITNVYHFWLPNNL